MKKEEIGDSPWMKLASEWALCKETHDIDAQSAQAMDEAINGVVRREAASGVMLPYLENYTGDMLGKAASQFPTLEEAQSRLDAVLDAEQSKIFRVPASEFPDKRDAELERFLRDSCNRLRNAAYDVLDRTYRK